MTQNNPLNDDHDALTNAGAIIDLFGGIRPMANKMGVPVTTVQGWKKRDVIPGNRRADVHEAAKTYGINIEAAAKVQNNFSSSLNQAHEEQVRHPETLQVHDAAIRAARETERQESMQRQVPQGISHEVMMSEIKKAQKTTEVRAARRSMVATTSLLTIFAIVFGMMIIIHKQQIAQQKQRIEIIEEEVRTIEESNSGTQAGAVQGMIDDMSQKFTALRDKTEEIQTTVQDLKSQAETLMDLDNGALIERVMSLETKVGGLPGGGDLSGLLGKLGDMQKTMQGQEQMQATVSQLQALVMGAQNQQDPAAVDMALMEAQQTGDSELAQTLEGVSPEQLKAAALLIGLSQFRDSMNRSGPYAEDLALLQSMLGDKDPELNAAIAQLAPYAEKGVLSPKGLSSELKTLTGEIVVASISGEDVSVQERAMARFQEILNIQKNGQPIMGTDAQAKVARAQAQLDAGNVEAALTELQSLDGPARDKAQPIIDQAEITRMAQEAQSLLAGGVMTKVKTGLTSVKNGVGGSKVPYVVSPGIKLPNIGIPAMPQNYTPMPLPAGE